MSLRFFIGLSLTVPALAAEPTPDAAPWDQTALGLFQDAHRAFAALPASDREARFGEAVTLINLQPKTDGNLDGAAELLTEVAATDATDDLGISARYFLARIAQVHRFEPDIPTALVYYRELSTLDSSHPLAQRAVVQLALIDLFVPDLPPVDLRARYDALQVRGRSLTDPAARRDFHLVMGTVALRFDLGEDLALDHLLAADAAGVVRAGTRRDNFIRIAELARRLHRNELAATYYTRFLEDFPRDIRRLTISERLAAITAAPPSGP